MPRIMKQGTTRIKVTEHIILRNFWEYYVTDRPSPEGMPDIKEALVLGYEQELGDFSQKEISPYVIARTKLLADVMPAPGWEWEH